MNLFHRTKILAGSLIVIGIVIYILLSLSSSETHLSTKIDLDDQQFVISKIKQRIESGFQNPHVKLIKSNDLISVPNHFNIVVVDHAHALILAIEQANKIGNTAIYLEAGEYKLTRPLILRGENIFILGNAMQPDDVVLSGIGMHETRQVNNILDVQSSGFVLDGVTLQEAPNHLIQIRAERNADYPLIRNSILQNGYEQLIKVSFNKQKQNFSKNGFITRCLFQYTHGIAPNYYTGGIDAHGIKNWYITNNVFMNIASPRQHISEHAIHIWNEAENSKVSGNIIINSDRGIGFGLSTITNEQGWSSQYNWIDNNFIYHAANEHPFADTGIGIEKSKFTVIDNNTIFMAHSYPNAIEYRFPATKQLYIRENKVNRRIAKRDGGHAVVMDNSGLNFETFKNQLYRHYEKLQLPFKVMLFN